MTIRKGTRHVHEVDLRHTAIGGCMYAGRNPARRNVNHNIRGPAGIDGHQARSDRPYAEGHGAVPTGGREAVLVPEQDTEGLSSVVG